jgi:catechol 2,3-dioxygenase-like lactoylglutathione lyase family enzyme
MRLSAYGWGHLGLRVTDLARVKHFYVDTLGCPLVHKNERSARRNKGKSDPWV